MYKLTQNPNIVERLADNAHIPLVEDNRDYIEYHAWVLEGNEPLPADEIIIDTPV